jgi:pimeloyl-ACP methyl ester carboxylesterase
MSHAHAPRVADSDIALPLALALPPFHATTAPVSQRPSKGFIVKTRFKPCALLFAVGLATLGMVAPSHAAGEADKPTVVLVHGAFDDGSGWNQVIPSLMAKGLKVVSVQNPLSSLADDVAATRRALDMQTGPVVLVGHSWGGMVITEIGTHERVKSLVYVAAFAPSVGQSITDMTKDYPKPSGLDHVVVDKEGFVSMTPEGIAKHFAQDVPAEKQRLMTVVQGPIRASAFDEKVTAAAWSTKPSWFIVADQDRMIQPALQLDNAKRIKAKIVRVPASHVPQLSRSKEVAQAILEATAAAQP